LGQNGALKKFISAGLSSGNGEIFLLSVNKNPDFSQGKKIRELGLIARLLIFPLGLLVRLWCMTLRFRFTQGEDLSALENQEKPSLILLWHNRLFLASEIYRRHRSSRRVYGLVSASRDGAWLAAFFRIMGIHAVRGSRNFRGSAALRGMIAELKSGNDVAITPDGSRGPCYDFKPGALLVAKTSGCPVILICPNFSCALRLNTWDRFFLPMPFSRVELNCKRFENLEAAGVTSLKEAGITSLKEQMDRMTI